MLRKIMFRGQRVDNKEWVYGSYRYYNETVLLTEINKHFIVPENQISGYEVDMETVGQYTGLNDKKGNEIYEGDVLCLDKLMNANWEIGFKGGGFYGKPLKSNMEVYQYEQHNRNYLQFEIIGSIHTNPELLKK